MSLNINATLIDPYEIPKNSKDKNKENDVKKSPSKNAHLMKRIDSSILYILS